MTTTLLDVGRTRALNDILRRSLSGGVLMLTAGIIALGRERQQAILDAIAAYDDFTPDNDPRGEHDFGALTVGGERVFFKIDYYDRALSGGSADPSDSSITTRMLTIMLAHEY
ncbi:hypothetical protein OPKNFCMD_3260 [Methylobacterium crusticola]|uniref:DUF3768 domain-containing protein n=1 Tax=Methylobacterium crusticola TaxID=1697972 RepID=A0ABQ4QYP4_9HYPH|nr:DUF3768 domain-containing protein [Methylobacterium crusticola]GJD50517.1 hypothetical protein OPKNFCMD_3260 [Methylobacterium crusticola]